MTQLRRLDEARYEAEQHNDRAAIRRIDEAKDRALAEFYPLDEEQITRHALAEAGFADPRDDAA